VNRDDPPIGGHGLIGDLQTSALVSTDGTIDWYCCPRFDAPSIFASVLDRARGGFFSITPARPGWVSRQMYLPDTAVLITRFMSADGVAELYDFMPVLSGGPTDRHRLVRQLRVVRGRMKFLIDCQPRFNYGRSEHKTELCEDGVAFHAQDGTELALHIVRRQNLSSTERPQLEHHDKGVRALVDVAEGEVGGLILESAPLEPPHEVSPAEMEELFDHTRGFWRGWIARSRYAGRWRQSVERSAMTLKLLTYQPTGAPIAAATLGLPEQAGGERNWDYRYTWVRDGSFSVRALLGLGYVEEAEAFLRWLGDRLPPAVASGSENGDPLLKIMYRVDGSSDLDEQVLDHLAGWQASRPVRVGNGAADQLQLDIYGEALDALAVGDANGIELTYDAWQRVSRVVEWLCANWTRPEEGIWETRGGQQAFTYGRLMSWVALDRAIRLACHHARPADIDRWTRVRDEIYDEIMLHDWSPDRGAFVQHDATTVLDASLLYMPIMGFITPHDPRWKMTMRAMERELVTDGLIFRYDPTASPDGLRGSEGTFSICTFWYVDVLARSGRVDDAQLAFEKMLTYTNHVGLFAEEIGPAGEQLGNFPQAFSHLALINAAITLDDKLNQRPAPALA
jgi:GH15 family glucan-1,4-alpha-glucosidase